ncbi:hypothetical protein B4U80_01093, partial [Leptotrombidium deliense]
MAAAKIYSSFIRGLLPVSSAVEKGLVTPCQLSSADPEADQRWAVHLKTSDRPFRARYQKITLAHWKGRHIGI